MQAAQVAVWCDESGGTKFTEILEMVGYAFVYGGVW